MSDTALPTTRPYLLRAIFSWCIDHGFTPYLTVCDSPGCQLPKKFVQNGLVTFNIGLKAAPQCLIGSDYLEFTASFGGVVEEIVVPISRIVALYAKENGQGLRFDAEPDPQGGLRSKNEQNMPSQLPTKESVQKENSWLKVLK